MNERILIIEDDQAILKLLQRGLAYEGYTVDTAMDGRMGLIAARDHTPDLVVLDWMLPGMDGLEVCHRLRQGGSIPILMDGKGEVRIFLRSDFYVRIIDRFVCFKITDKQGKVCRFTWPYGFIAKQKFIPG